ncbi:hypothetical protein [Nonomuraea sp. NPDC050643]|uniref:hypothetical protein n=1 Tax=Nonomuraea sp. NPDC050643 TaxID=3155660 RepID=UPI003400B822
MRLPSFRPSRKFYQVAPVTGRAQEAGGGVEHRLAFDAGRLLAREGGGPGADTSQQVAVADLPPEALVEVVGSSPVRGAR